MLKTFRVLTRNPVMGYQKYETFEAQWPNKALERRIAAHQLEMVEEKPKPEPKKAPARKPKEKEEEKEA